MAPTRRLDMVYQTLYSELVQRSLDESFTSEFRADGRFVAVEVKNKKYWYFDTPKSEGGGQDRRYVGPVDDPEITERVEAFKDLKADLKGRRRLVSTLTREAYLPRPLPIAGQVVEALAKAGLFRLRGVLVGTAAYQCYSAVLGTRLDAVAMQTGDADFAQFHETSVAIKDSIPPILGVLREADPTFREVPSQTDGRVSTQFVARSKFKVEFLTPNRGTDDQEGKPVPMPALGGAAAFPLRFLDYLIYQPIRAVLLYGAGVPLLIPSPERYAIHKLIVGSRRKEERDATAKSSKDRLQAKSIIEVMIANRQHADLASVFMEAWDRGDHWKAAIRTSLATYDNDVHNSFRTELAKGVTELGSDPAKYDLVDQPADASTPRTK
ncbi:nucleotidyltransferase family protein [Bradyrhizobium prioriisuperbiae]|uniref:nucleotidyltransferase family protein n=1 Tax=Bradyrhizobium prioriisuperbiae TaxID=2854389 RepID=UPI0028E2A501|nr:GSU2403 family nucleotidyltransferase fold protein [Bradyrhizobium prioritasuperba]